MDKIKLMLLHYLFRKEVQTMRDIYVALIIAKRRTIDKIKNQTLKEQVLADLNALGYDGYGNLLADEQE